MSGPLKTETISHLDLGPTYRCSFRLPQHLALELSFVAKRLGVSQSLLLAELLAQPLDWMARLFRQLGDEPTPAQVEQTLRTARETLVDLSKQAARLADETDD